MSRGRRSSLPPDNGASADCVLRSLFPLLLRAAPAAALVALAPAPSVRVGQTEGVGNISNVLNALNETADQDLGAVVEVLDSRGLFEVADAMEHASLSYDFDSEWMDGMSVTPVLRLAPRLLGLVDEAAFAIIDETCRSLVEDVFVKVAGLAVKPQVPPPNWRELRAATNETGRGLNQGSPGAQILQDGLKFSSAEELKVYLALRRKQAQLPPEATIGIMPGCAMRVGERKFWPDFLVTYQARAGVIEVDGPHHHGRAAADQSRDRQLEDAGVVLVERIVVEDVTDDAGLEIFIERFLSRLLSRRG